MIRRVVVLGVIVLLLVVLVSAVRGIVGGNESSSPESTSSSAPDSAVSSPVSTPSPTAPTEPTETTDVRVPSVADPARVLLVGDSEAQGLGPFLQSVLDVDKLTTLTVDGRNSTGLVRDDFFDWPAHLNEIVPTADPDIVVAFFGGNDGQSFQTMPTKRVDSPEWRAEYGKRVGAVMDFLGADGRTLIWIGVPNAADADFSARLTVLNSVINEQVRSHPNVVFVDSWRLFSGIDGGYAPLVLDPLSGTYIAVQAERDKFHLNTAGTKILAAAVGQAISDDLVVRGASTTGDPTSTTIDINSPGSYTIVEGDTLTGIAAKTGTNIGAIVSVNGWADENEVIQVGQGIKLPAKSP